MVMVGRAGYIVRESSEARCILLPENLFSFSFPRDVFSEDKLTFTLAEISKSFPYPLVRVAYAYTTGRETKEGGLVLDTGKRVFLDHIEIPKIDEAAQKFAPKIADYVALIVLNTVQSRGLEDLPALPSIPEHFIE
jgi:hypothetical protein